MERNGTLTDIGNLNREIRETNHLISSVKRTILLLMDWLSEIRDVITEINAEPQTIYLAELLARRFEERKQERIVKWQSGYSIQTADQKDLKYFADIIAYMHETKVLTITDLQERFASLNSEIYPIRKELKQINRQLNHIRKLIDCMDTLSRLAPIQEEYSKIFWKRRKEQFAKEHKEELKQWYKTNQYIKEHCRDGFPDLSVLKHRISSLEIKKQDLKASIEPMQSEMNKLSEIRYYIMDLIPELMPNKEPMTAEKITAKRESLLIRLDKAKEESAVRYNQQHTKIREEDKCTTLRSKSNEQTM
jgi:prefoldin subunit 5